MEKREVSIKLRLTESELDQIQCRMQEYQPQTVCSGMVCDTSKWATFCSGLMPLNNGRTTRGDA